MEQQKHFLVLFIYIFFIGIMLPACVSTVVPTPALLPATVTLSPVPTDTPTPQPTLTSTPEPSKTSTPIDTSVPTITKQPSQTPTSLPETLKFDGTGNSKFDVDMSKIGEPAIAHIVGNNEAGNFLQVEALYGDQGQNRLILVYGTYSPYDGYAQIGLFNQLFKRIEVYATSEWSIEILPVELGHFLQVPGIYYGKGDDIIFLTGTTPDTWQLWGHFSLMGWACTDGWKYGDFGFPTAPTPQPHFWNGDDWYKFRCHTPFAFFVRAIGEWSLKIKE